MKKPLIKTSKNPRSNCSEIEQTNQLLFKPLGIETTTIVAEIVNENYFAHTFMLNKFKVAFRSAKITPKKIGQFVALWKRNVTGTSVPYSWSDSHDIYIIAARKDSNFGLFIFPKNLLLQNGILSNKFKEGKRGFRVYPIWEETTNKQAIQTQIWQTKYFIDLSAENKIDFKKAKELLGLK